MSLREDLPTQPDYMYDLNDILCFDEYRAEYKNTVSIAKKLFKDRITVLTKSDCKYESQGREYSLFDILTSSNPELKLMYASLVLGKNLQVMYHHWTQHPSTSGDGYYTDIKQIGKFLTAFYIPYDINWFKLQIGGNIVGFYNNTDIPRNLEEILREAITIPAQNNTLENILMMSREGKIVLIHNMEETIVVNGIAYKRFVCVQPFLSVVKYQQIRLILSEFCGFFVEWSGMGPMVPNGDGGFKPVIDDNVKLTYFFEGQEDPIYQTHEGVGWRPKKRDIMENRTPFKSNKPWDLRVTRGLAGSGDHMQQNTDMTYLLHKPQLPIFLPPIRHHLLPVCYPPMEIFNDRINDPSKISSYFG